MGKHTFDSAHGRLDLLLLVACALHAHAVHAQTTQDKHHLLASGRAGNQVEADAEVDRFDGRAEVVLQGGVQGANPSFFVHEAVADGDAGLLSIFSRFSLAGPDLDPLSRSEHRTVALIEESVDPEFLSSGPVTFTAQLNWDGSGSPNDGNGEPNSASVSAGLRVNMCSVGFQQTFYSTGFGEGTPSESCSNTAHVTNTTAAGAGLLSITQTMDGSALPTRFYVTAQIEGQASYFGPDDGAEYEASGTLSIEVTGVGYSFSSPTFLTLPEPGAAALVVTAVAPLAALARRRRHR
jgi:hypothetical protein